MQHTVYYTACMQHAVYTKSNEPLWHILDIDDRTAHCIWRRGQWAFMMCWQIKTTYCYLLFCHIIALTDLLHFGVLKVIWRITSEATLCKLGLLFHGFCCRRQKSPVDTVFTGSGRWQCRYIGLLYYLSSDMLLLVWPVCQSTVEHANHQTTTALTLTSKSKDQLYTRVLNGGGGTSAMAR